MAQPLSTVLSGGRVLLPDGTIADADIAVSGDRISGIGVHGAFDGGDKVDVRGLLVMPGAIDSHIHLGHGNDISRPRVKTDAVTETASAAAGGVTTFLSYVIAAEPFEQGVLKDIVSITESGARTDFGFHLVISTEAQLAAVPLYAREWGIPSFKVFMYCRGGEGKRLGLPDLDDGFLFRLAEQTAAAGGVLCPHCENIEVGWVFSKRLKQEDPEGRGGLEAWNRARPAFIEAEAVHRVGTLAREAGAQVYMVHCTSALALEAGLAQRRLGTRMAIETCQQYLTHTSSWEGGDIAKVSPPIRHAADREALWKAIAAGDIDTVATDHVHRTAKGKAGGIWAASPGFPGMETLLPVLLSEGHHKRGIPLGTIARVVSANPARLMGCRTKGAIAVGMDADFAVVDLGAEWTADARQMHSDAGFSIYDGWRFKGRIVHTLVRGRLVMRDRKLDDAAIGTGRFVRRSAAPAA